MAIPANIINSIFEIFESENPSPKVELNYINDFTFLLAVLLSAQTTDKSVNKATGPLFKVVQSPEDILDLGLDRLKSFISTLGLYNTKSKNIIELSKILISRYNSKVPHIRDELEKLPGIGRKSANVIANTLYGEPCIAVDTHVLRVSKRLGLSNSSNPIQVESDLLDVVPLQFHKNASNWLVLHGRYTCLARSPRCDSCKLRTFCKYFYNT